VVKNELKIKPHRAFVLWGFFMPDGLAGIADKETGNI
jgi:hypothetical protein